MRLTPVAACLLAASRCAQIEVSDEPDGSSGPVESPPTAPRDGVPPVGGAPASPCGDLTPAGRCEGDLLRWCHEDAPRELDCATVGERCGEEAPGRFSCQPHALGAGCGVPPERACAESVLSFCVGDELRTQDCAEAGLSCGWDDQLGAFRCRSGEAPPPACAGVPDGGTCLGHVLTRCEGDEVVRVDCRNQGARCAVDEGRSACVPGAPPAEPDDADGDGVPREEDCDDGDPTTFPGAAERCDPVDHDCDGRPHESCDERCRPRTRGGQLYLFCRFERTADEARDWCRRRGFELAGLDDPEEDRWARHEAADVAGEPARGWWIGLEDRAEEGRYVWGDGSLADHLGWRAGQPNDHRTPDEQDCVLLNRRGPEQGWDDRNCEGYDDDLDVEFFICEWPD